MPKMTLAPYLCQNSSTLKYRPWHSSDSSTTWSKTSATQPFYRHYRPRWQRTPCNPPRKPCSAPKTKPLKPSKTALLRTRMKMGRMRASRERRASVGRVWRCRITSISATSLNQRVTRNSLTWSLRSTASTQRPSRGIPRRSLKPAKPISHALNSFETSKSLLESQFSIKKSNKRHKMNKKIKKNVMK